MIEKPPIQKPSDHFSVAKLTFKEKIVYSLGALPGTFFGSFTGQIQAFYFKWMGLNIIYIIIGQIFYGIWNLINDPIFGVLQDRTRSKNGRYIPWIKFFSPLFTIAFIILFFPPQVWRYNIGGEQYQFELGMWYLFSQIAYDTFFTIVYLAHVALAPQMTMDQEERTQISILSTVMGMIGAGLSAFFPLLFLTNPTPEKIMYFQILVIVFGISAYVPWIFIGKILKERLEFIPSEEMSFVESLKCVFKNPSGRIYMIYDGISVGLLNTLGTAVTFLFEWILGINSENLDPTWGISHLIPYAVAPVVCFLVGIKIELTIPKKKDVRTALMYSMITETIGFLIAYLGVLLSTNLKADTYFVPNGLWAVSLGLSIACLGISGDFIYHNVMRADTIDFDEYLTGERRESVYAGVGCLLSKPMISVVLALVPTIIFMFGLEPASPEDITRSAMVVRKGYANAIIGVATASFLVCAILALIGVIAWHWYPLDQKRLQTVREALSKMHQIKRSERLTTEGASKFIPK